MNPALAAATVLAQDYAVDPVVDSTVLGLFAIFSLSMLAVGLLCMVAMWKMFTKAGEPGWATLVPVYNMVVLTRIVGRPAWWVVLYMIPLVNIVIAVILCFDTAKAYGKDAAFGLVLLFLPFVGYPMLGFGDARYVGLTAA